MANPDCVKYLGSNEAVCLLLRIDVNGGWPAGGWRGWATMLELVGKKCDELDVDPQDVRLSVTSGIELVVPLREDQLSKDWSAVCAELEAIISAEYLRQQAELQKSEPQGG